MRTHSTISGSELLLGVIAIRLAVLVVVGWSLTLLPQHARNSEPVCFPFPAATAEAQRPTQADGHRMADAAVGDMLLRD